ncbi:MAG: M20/M25/M40 family metallo-hydrolase [Clostridia bacterium]|nr:M20/M25/M40 family metallo-hydrolase [Clostridia bacterium]
MRFDELNPKRVFKYFEEICHIPHGSGDMKRIADYCEAFAMARGLKYHRDGANNIIIYKSASKGYENADPIILQGHLDMVCQKNDDITKDFLTEGIEPYIDGDFVRAKGTTLGADNGIAVSMILAILESNEYEHPAIEAVFTTDEETGMYGAASLDYSLLSAKRMINLDAEEDDTVTVSCAGGSNFNIKIPLTREKRTGDYVNVTLKGLIGGHSGVEIHKGRINSNVLAGRFLNELIQKSDASLVNISGGDKANAITRSTSLSFCVEDIDGFNAIATDILDSIKMAISDREPQLIMRLKPAVTVFLSR